MLVKARFRIVGFKSFVEGVALVDTGATFTILDKSVADTIGVRYIGKKIRIAVADGHEIEGELAIVDKLAIEDEELPHVYVVVTELSDKVKEVLRRAGLCDYLIIGVTTLELLQLVPDPTTDKLQKNSSITHLR